MISSLETEINKFKSNSEYYDTSSDPSFVSFNNIDLSDFTLLGTSSETDCKAVCSVDSNCVAYAFVDGSCNKYRNINYDFQSGSDTLHIKKNNDYLIGIGNYLINTNTNIINTAEKMKTYLENYNEKYADFLFDGNDEDKTNLNLSFNAFKETQKEYRNLIASNETNMDPIVVNTHYIRYLFLFTLMFIMMTSLIYFTVNNTSNSGSNFMLYLVLFIILFSVSIIYILK